MSYATQVAHYDTWRAAREVQSLSRQNRANHSRSMHADRVRKPFDTLVLRHRFVLSYEAAADNVTSEQIISKILDFVPVP